MTKPTVSKHWRKPVGRQRSGLNPNRTTPPCYNATNGIDVMLGSLISWWVSCYLHVFAYHKHKPWARKSRSFGSSEYEIPAFFRSSMYSSHRTGEDMSAAVRSGCQQNYNISIFYLMPWLHVKQNYSQLFQPSSGRSQICKNGRYSAGAEIWYSPNTIWSESATNAVTTPKPMSLTYWEWVSV